MIRADSLLITVCVAASLAALSGCERYQAFKGSFSQATGQGQSSGNSTSNGTVSNAVTSDVSNEIQLVDTKFSGQEAKLEALVKFSGMTSPRLKLGTDAKFKVEDLPAGKADQLVVELYEGDKLRFVAKQNNVQFEKTKSSSVKIEDCNILKAPWDGASNDGNCNWDITEVK